jgi:hypothetical protein
VVSKSPNRSDLYRKTVLLIDRNQPTRDVRIRRFVAAA